MNGTRVDRGQEKTAVATQTTHQTMTNDNTRSKANAVFFSAIMVLSMVGVGFAAAPAAANATGGSIDTFNDQPLNDDGSVDVEASATGSTPDATVVVTYPNSSGALIVAGLQDFSGSSNNVDVAIDDTGGFPGDHTAHVIPQNETSGLSDGNVVDPNTTTIYDSQTASIRSASNAGRDGKDIFNGSTIYQGEDDLNFIDNNGDSVSPAALQKTAGNEEGTSLALPIAEDAATGTYERSSAPTYSVVVQEPRITTAEVQLNSSGSDVSEVSTDDDIKIVGEWNFADAEDVEITVEDPNGADITNEVTNNDVLDNSGDEIGLDLSGEDAGDYTIVFEGSDDLDYGGVVEEYTLTLTNQDEISIEVDEDSVTQGDNVDFTISGGTDGDEHTVVIEESEYRDNIGGDAENVFRNVGDTNEVGSATPSGTNYSFAVVEIDGTTATGAIETQFVDDSSIDVEVYDSNEFSSSGFNGIFNGSNLPASSTDDASFDVEEGEVALTSPDDNYVVGSDVDVNGTAETADEVRLYAKDNNDWEIVEVDDDLNITVDSDDTFEEEDVTLSNGDGGGNDILSFSGRYEIGVIDVQDAIDVEDGSGTGSTITTSDWTTSSSSRSSINVVEGDLSGNFATVNGQVAEEDGILDVDGTAAGQNEVVVAFVDDRGNTQATTISVDDDQTFEEDDVSLGDLRQGTVTAHVISQGRDNTIGDGELPNTTSVTNPSNPTTSDLRGFIDDLEDQGSLSGNQVRDRIVAETVEADASDDLIVNAEFRLSDGRVSIDSVYPEGAQADGINPVAANETMVVEGTTNRKADDNSIVVDVLNENGE